MISRLSNFITQNLLKRKTISDDEKELYDYGLFMMLSYIVFFLISILFGIVLNIPYSSILFYITFCLIRNFAGGAHANTEIKCDIITTLSIFTSEILIKIFVEYSFVSIAFVMQLIFSICLCVIKPVATSQKEISQQEKLHFHKKVVLLTVLALIISVASMTLGVYNIAFSISVGLSLASILLMIGKLKQKLSRKNNDKKQ